MKRFKIFPRFRKISEEICSRRYELLKDLFRVMKKCWMQNLAHLLLFYFRILFTCSFVVWGGICTFFFFHFFRGLCFRYRRSWLAFFAQGTFYKFHWRRIFCFQYLNVHEFIFLIRAWVSLWFVIWEVCGSSSLLVYVVPEEFRPICAQV